VPPPDRRELLTRQKVNECMVDDERDSESEGKGDHRPEREVGPRGGELEGDRDEEPEQHERATNRFHDRR